MEIKKGEKKWMSVAEYAKKKGVPRHKVYSDIYSGRMSQGQWREIKIRVEQTHYEVKDV